MPGWFEAAFWGLVAGSALLLGAAVGYAARIPARVIAGIMAFGAGILISALAFDLMDEAYAQGGFDSTAAGFLTGAAVYTGAKMIPEAFEQTHNFTGFITVAGFLSAFILTKTQ